jgi:hypothetical protein
VASNADLEIGNPAGPSSRRDDRLAGRITALSASDSQFAAAEPVAGVIDAARRPGLRLPLIIETLVGGYADRPALGQRARELVTDSATGRTWARLLPSFDTITVPDSFTRLVLSLLVTGIAPLSFYRVAGEGARPKAHYDGLPADFVAESVTMLGAQTTEGFRSFDVMNPHDDGISLDTFVDWLIDAGHEIARIDDYDDWLARFETALKALPEKQRQQSVLPLLGFYRDPQQPLLGAPAPTEVFHAAVRAGGLGADNDIPHISAELIDKYATDLHHLRLL